VIGVSGDPVAIVLGLIEVIAGPWTTNVFAAEDEVDVFHTVTPGIAAEASSPLVTAAVREVALT